MADEPKLRNGSVTFIWAGEERTFRLRLGELRELQTFCDAGPEEIKNRIETGKWRVDDLREVIRLGLIGGGTPSSQVVILMKQHFDDVEPMHNKIPAFIVISAGLAGDPQDVVGKKQKRRRPRAKQADVSPSPQSTATVSSSDFPQDKLMS